VLGRRTIGAHHRIGNLVGFALGRIVDRELALHPRAGASERPRRIREPTDWERTGLNQFLNRTISERALQTERILGQR
jgi:hypothetical protein